MDSRQPSRPLPPALPFVTYLVNAGLSEWDAREVTGELLRRVKLRLQKKALGDSEIERRRYLTDAQYRIRLNQEIIAEEVLLMNFSGDELREIDRGLQLGVAPRDTQKKRTAYVYQDGELVDELELEELGDPTLQDRDTRDRLKRLRVRGKRSGKVFEV